MVPLPHRAHSCSSPLCLRPHKQSSTILFPETKWYLIVYEDRDKEELNRSELNEVMVPLDLEAPLDVWLSQLAKALSENEKSQRQEKHKTRRQEKGKKMLMKKRLTKKYKKMLMKKMFMGK